MVMKLSDFKLERFFSRYEFASPYLMCCSDCESFTIQELLDLEGDDARAGLLDLGLGYTESNGHPGLRQQISRLYQEIDADQVLVTSGAEEAIFVFMNALLKPGDHVIVQHPCYQSLLEIPRSIGCELSCWPMRAENDWSPDLNLLADSIRENTRLIIVNSPHNPTGYLMPGSDLEQLVKLAAGKGICLFSDEVYRFLEYDRGIEAKAACDLYENAVSLGVMSKSYGLAGLRIGWLATSNPGLYRRLAAFKDYTSICNSGPSEFLAALALRHGDRILARNRAIIADNLPLLDDFFLRHSHLFEWVRPRAGCIAFPRLKLERDIDAFCSQLVSECGVLLLPGTCYDYDSRHFRIGFGRRNFPECLAQLEGYLG
jgi:aspartate/methionine/tyrosine aminotransferase